MVDLVEAIEKVAKIISGEGLDYVTAVNSVCDGYGDRVEEEFSRNKEDGICEHNGRLSRECRRIEELRCILLRNGGYSLSAVSSRDSHKYSNYPSAVVIHPDFTIRRDVPNTPASYRVA